MNSQISPKFGFFWLLPSFCLIKIGCVPLYVESLNDIVAFLASLIRLRMPNTDILMSTVKHCAPIVFSSFLIFWNSSSITFLLFSCYTKKRARICPSNFPSLLMILKYCGLAYSYFDIDLMGTKKSPIERLLSNRPVD